MARNMYRPENRSYWEIKEGWIQSWYPDLIHALFKEQHPSRRGLLFEACRNKIGTKHGTSRVQIEQGGTEVSRRQGSYDAAQGSCKQLDQMIILQ